MYAQVLTCSRSGANQPPLSTMVRAPGHKITGRGKSEFDLPPEFDHSKALEPLGFGFLFAKDDGTGPNKDW